MRQVPGGLWVVLEIKDLFWLPTLDTFRTFLTANSESNALTNLVLAAGMPESEARVHVY